MTPSPLRRLKIFLDLGILKKLAQYTCNPASRDNFLPVPFFRFSSSWGFHAIGSVRVPDYGNARVASNLFFSPGNEDIFTVFTDRCFYVVVELSQHHTIK